MSRKKLTLFWSIKRDPKHADKENYRQISLISIACKVCEKIVKQREINFWQDLWVLNNPVRVPGGKINCTTGFRPEINLRLLTSYFLISLKRSIHSLTSAYSSNWKVISGGSRPSDKGWRGGGGGHPDPEISGGKIFFRPIGPQFGLKLRGGPRHPGPLRWIRHWLRNKDQPAVVV